MNPEPPVHPGGTIMIVDDNPNNLRLLAEKLGKHGYRVLGARDPAMALVAADRAPPDLFLLDICMPGMDGYELCRRLAQGERTHNVPVIFTSALGETVDKVEGFKAGAVDYVVKPFQPEEVLARIRTHLDLARLRHHLAEEVGRRTRSLEESERRLALALAGGNQGIWDVATAGPEPAISPSTAAMLGYQPGQTVPEWRRLLHDEDDTAWRGFLADCAAGLAVTCELRLRRGDGAWAWVLARGQQIGTDTAARVTGTFTDISQRRRMEEDLRAAKRAAEVANEAKARFLATMSHELRTPLHGVVGSCELLKDRLEGEDRELVEIISVSAQRFTALIDRILQVTELRRAAPELHPEAVEVSSLLDEAVARRRNEIETKHLRLDVEVGPAVGTCSLDRERVGQVLEVLLDNAIAFTERGWIRLAAELAADGADERRLLLTVSDSGVGMDAELLAAATEAFVIGDPSTTRLHGGSGLGLTLAKYLAEALRGQLLLDSVPGGGTTARLDLPYEPVTAGRPRTKTTLLGPAIAPGLRVLVAEDNAVNQQVVQAMLERLGCEVTMAANGYDAVEAFLGHQDYDLAILDCDMPLLDGLEATKVMREAETSDRRLPIIALTAHARAFNRTRCLAAGMDDYLTKPLTLQELAACLGRWCPAGESG